MKLYFDLPVIKRKEKNFIEKEKVLNEDKGLIEHITEVFKYCLHETYYNLDLFSTKDEVLSKVKECLFNTNNLKDISKNTLEDISKNTLENTLEDLWKNYMYRNEKIIEIFEELKDDSLYSNNRFRTKSYERAISVIDNLEVPIISGKQAQTLPGIGVKLGEKIDEIIETGELESISNRSFEERKRIHILKEFEKIWGIGPKKAVKLYEEGYRKIEEIPLSRIQISGLKYYKDLQKRIPRGEITLFKKKILKTLKKIEQKTWFYTSKSKLKDKHKNVLKTCICGSYRRGKSTSGDIDVLLSYDGENVPPRLFEKILSFLKDEGIIISDLSKGSKNYSGITKTNDGIARRIDIHFVPIKEWGSQILYFTGSKEFNIDMRNLAIRKGFKLSDKGLFDKINRRLPLYTEKSIFLALGLPYIKPQDRKDLSKWV